MKTFEYMNLDCPLPSGVNKMMTEIQKLGKQGWELIAVCPTTSSGYGIETLTAFLKKTKE